MNSSRDSISRPKPTPRFASLSGGQRQTLFLALAVINRPSVLVLDEPTAGLDPHARRRLHGLIRETRAEGRTVLLSTHNLEEAAELCDQVAIMDAGRIVAAGTPAELTGRSHAPARVIVRTEPPLPESAIEGLPGLIEAAYRDHGWVLETGAPNRLMAELMRRVNDANAELLEIELRRPSLEDVLIELTAGRRDDADPGGASR